MTAVSFTLGAVDVTILVPDSAVWWSCFACDTDVELAVLESAGILVSCPDCAGPLEELWCWEPAAA